MLPVQTEDTNVTLTLPGQGTDGDLPALRCYFEDPRGRRSDGFETAWEPDDGERRALVNGAPVILRVWGTGHPPVSVSAGEPTGDVDRLVSAPQLWAAIPDFLECFGLYMAGVERAVDAGGEAPTTTTMAERTLSLLWSAIDATSINVPDLIVPPSSNGHSATAKEEPEEGPA